MQIETMMNQMNEATIKKKDKEIEELKSRLQQKVDEATNVYKRDIMMMMKIDECLEDFTSTSAKDTLQTLYKQLQSPDNFNDSILVKKDEFDTLITEIDRLNLTEKNSARSDGKIAQLQEEVKRLQREVDELEDEIRARENKYEQKIREEKQLIQTKMQKEKEEVYKELIKIKDEFSKMEAEYKVKIDKLREERDLEKYLLKKEKENKPPRVDPNSFVEMENLKNTNAKLEGMLLNKNKELQVVWDKMKYFQQLANM